jgi:hypothetical protein
MEMLFVSKEVAAIIAVGIVILVAIRVWKTPAPNCCEHFGFNCREGRDCPLRKERNENYRPHF